jgi:hypothetical protein
MTYASAVIIVVIPVVHGHSAVSDLRLMHL